ncbi:MAG: hypothetical protein IE878_06255, partial [Epsilonproteobacteria bacterium]|nr:hypothetical protein [Campylobacterota bacterium]
ADTYKVKYDFYGDINKIAEEFHDSLGYTTKEKLIDDYKKSFPILARCKNELPMSVFYHTFDKLIFDKKLLMSIGTFAVDSPKIIVSDISHSKNTWCTIELKDTVPGKWSAFKKLDGKKIKELIELGVDVFRINFSHGDYTEHTQIIKKNSANFNTTQ